MVIDHFGGPEVLSLGDVDKPEPGPDEVLVKVIAAGGPGPVLAHLLVRPGVFLLVVAASIAAALIGLALGDVGRAILSWIFNALTQPVAALTTSVLNFTLLQVRGATEPPQA